MTTTLSNTEQSPLDLDALSGHTPGPWPLETVSTSAGSCHRVGSFPAANERTNYACIYADRIRMGIDDDLPRAKELLANARLIAAAPDLLALARTQAAQLAAPRGTDAQIIKERELTCSAVDGAIAFGEANEEQPPAGHWLEPYFRIGERLRTQAAELDGLRKLVNSPELHDFASGVTLEAAHQRERWGTGHDSGKTPPDWFWLVGYLAGKALAAHLAGNPDKALHHTISTAAALANWHGAILGTHDMRPGIDGESGFATLASAEVGK